MKLVIYLLAVHLLAQQGADVSDLDKERALGRHYAAEIRRQSDSAVDPPVQAYVDRVGRELSSGLTDQRLEYQFELISGGDWTEPVALPGGYVFIPARSFITARDEHEFAGTLAHAIAHAALRHRTRTATRGQAANMASIPLVFMGGWTGSHADSQLSRVLVPASFLEFQRTCELEADRVGLELAARTGYDAAAFVRYVERTHPADYKNSPLPGRDRRIDRLQETVASLPGAARPDSGDYKNIQERVRLMTERPPQHRVPTLR
jgi:predicted Zn-dependent protease